MACICTLVFMFDYGVRRLWSYVCAHWTLAHQLQFDRVGWLTDLCTRVQTRRIVILEKGTLDGEIWEVIIVSCLPYTSLTTIKGPQRMRLTNSRLL
jgi:hypothetical protein